MFRDCFHFSLNKAYVNILALSLVHYLNRRTEERTDRHTFARTKFDMPRFVDIFYEFPACLIVISIINFDLLSSASVPHQNFRVKEYSLSSNRIKHFQWFLHWGWSESIFEKCSKYHHVCQEYGSLWSNSLTFFFASKKGVMPALKSAVLDFIIKKCCMRKSAFFCRSIFNILLFSFDFVHGFSVSNFLTLSRRCVPNDHPVKMAPKWTVNQPHLFVFPIGWCSLSQLTMFL